MRAAARLILAAILCTSLILLVTTSVVALSAVSGRWEGTLTTDPITDEQRFKVSLVTMHVNGEMFSDKLAGIELECTAGEPRMTIAWSFKAVGKTALVTQYRFGNLPGRAIAARYVNPSTLYATDPEDLRVFLDDARASETLYLRVQSDARGVADATFGARVGRSMVAHFTEACPSVRP